MRKRATVTIAGIELLHRIRKGQFDVGWTQLGPERLNYACCASAQVLDREHSLALVQISAGLWTFLCTRLISS
jgi:hypothetical protein